MGQQERTSPLLPILGSNELLEELTEAIEVNLSQMVEDNKISQTQYDAVAKVFQDRFNLTINPASVTTSAPIKDDAPEHSTATKNEARRLLKRVTSKNVEAKTFDTSGTLDDSEFDEEFDDQHIKDAKAEGKYPAKAEDQQPQPFIAPDFYEWKGKKYTRPDWAGVRKGWKAFCQNIKRNKWTGPEWPTKIESKKNIVIENKTKTTSQIAAPPPSKEQRRELRRRVEAGSVGSERTLPKGPDVEMFGVTKQPGVTSAKIVKEAEVTPEGVVLDDAMFA